MTSRTLMAGARAAVLAATVGITACGGNYSNEDLDFQAALPERSDLSAKLPQALGVADEAEYHRITREQVAGFNAILNAFLGIIDYVRGFPPSERMAAMRIWGPFPNDKQPGWDVRMVMERVADPGVPMFGYHFEYRIEMRATGSVAGPWLVFLSGRFVPSGGVRKGAGELHIDTRPGRAAAYPLGDFGPLEQLDIGYQTMNFPITVAVHVVNLPEVSGNPHPEATINYSEREDSSGEFSFVVQAKDTDIEIRSRWLGSGAGRADAKIVGGFGLGRKGIDCWGPDTRPTYIHRDGLPPFNKGDVATCVLGDPLP